MTEFGIGNSRMSLMKELSLAWLRALSLEPNLAKNAYSDIKSIQ
jgi:hypothetical protein